MTKPTNKPDYSAKNKKQNNPGTQLFEIGKMPPQAVDLEEAVLGALMLDKEAVGQIIDILVPQSFYKEAHQIIYTAIQNLFRLGEPIDILTVTQAVKKAEKLEMVGGAYYISQLTNRVGSTVHAEFHARIISQKYMLRELIRVSTENIRDCYEENVDVFQLLENAQASIIEIMSENIKSQGQDATEAFKEWKAYIEKTSKHTDEITGVRSGITALDKLTNGWQNSDLIIIAARPGMGKSAFAKANIRGAISQKKAVAIMTLEMSNRQVVSRLMSEDTGASSSSFNKGDWTKYTSWDAIEKAIAKYYDENGNSLVHFDDKPSLSVYELRAKARRLKRRLNIGLLLVDYLQLMDSGDDNRNREQEISKISRGLKSLAKELDIPIIAFAQLSRAVETDGASGLMKPKLSHLRESGSIEQDADMVMFIWRPWYYVEQLGREDLREIEFRGEQISTENFAELILAKHRNGPLGAVGAKFIGHLTQFVDWDSAPPERTAPLVQPPIDGQSNANAGIGPNTDFLNTGNSKNDIEEEPPF